MKKLSIESLKKAAIKFCTAESKVNHTELIGVTDGKAVGSYIEHKFKKFLSFKFDFTAGNSAKGIDLPDDHICTDIKVTSLKQPQSSCPFKNARQKVFGLDYNLLVFVYVKEDTAGYCELNFKNVTFIDKEHTGDYSVTTRLRAMVSDGANICDIVGYFNDIYLPGDASTYEQLAHEVLTNHVEQGYLTISNALQWRLQYRRAIELNNKVQGIMNYDR